MGVLQCAHQACSAHFLDSCSVQSCSAFTGAQRRHAHITPSATPAAVIQLAVGGLLLYPACYSGIMSSVYVVCVQEVCSRHAAVWCVHV
jgi:hypothetical protein